MSSKIGDINEKYNVGNDPVVDMKIDNKRWDREQFPISKVNVITSVWGEAGTCSVEISDLSSNLADRLKSDFSYKNVKIGAKLEISLGNTEGEDSFETNKVFLGYVYAVDINISNGSTIVVVQGMDAKVWMMSNCKTRQINGTKKYSNVVNQICTKDYTGKILSNKIKVDGEIEFPDNYIIYQINESDYEFICRMAKTIGALFFIDRGILYFIDPFQSSRSKLEIDASSEGVISIKGITDIWGIPKSVRFSAIDGKDYKRRVVATEQKPKAVGSGKQANSIVRSIPKDNTIGIVNNNANSVKNAQSLAKALMTVRGLNFFKVIIETTGNPETKLGTSVSLTNISAPFNNEYIVTGIEHIVNGIEYITKLTLGTNTVKMENDFSLF